MFEIVIATEFERIPPVILGLINVVVVGCPIPIKHKYLLHFSNPRTAMVGTLVISWRIVRRKIRSQQPSATTGTFDPYIEQHFDEKLLTNATISVGTTSSLETLELYTYFPIVYDHTPETWKLMSGEYPASITVKSYIVNTKLSDPHGDPQKGLLVTYDYNHGRVVSVERKSFALTPKPETTLSSLEV